MNFAAGRIQPERNGKTNEDKPERGAGQGVGASRIEPHAGTSWMPPWRYLSEIYDMQVQAIIEAACNVKKKGVTVYPEIMLPLISTEQEFGLLKDDVHRIAKEVMQKRGMKIEYMVGTMIELPRAALIADKIAKHAEFFSLRDQ